MEKSDAPVLDAMINGLTPLLPVSENVEIREDDPIPMLPFASIEKSDSLVDDATVKSVAVGLVVVPWTVKREFGVVEPIPTFPLLVMVKRSRPVPDGLSKIANLSTDAPRPARDHVDVPRFKNSDQMFPHLADGEPSENEEMLEVNGPSGMMSRNEEVEVTVRREDGVEDPIPILPF